jgi:uroporphyrin-3 C-methyltransferase
MADNQNRTPGNGDESRLEPAPTGDGDLAAPPAPEAESETEPDAESEPAKARARDGAGRRRGGAVAWLSLLLALAALGGAGYLYYILVYHSASAQREAALEAEVDGLSRRLEAQAGRLDGLNEAQQRTLDAFREDEQQLLAKTRADLAAALADVQRQTAPSPKEWKLAEVEYLLRIANHRVLMERDVAGAEHLLSAADNILEELDDFALYPVRAALADELSALRSVETVDLSGLYLRIEAIKKRIEALPLRLPEYLRTESPAPPVEERSVWQVLAAKLGEYFRFRRFDGATKPLLAPEEAVYLELNLRLMLERAQLALLRREQTVYEQSLGTAREWLVRYLDATEPAVQDVIEDLDELMNVDLEQSLPDVSGSLNALLELRRTES